MAPAKLRCPLHLFVGVRLPLGKGGEWVLGFFFLPSPSSTPKIRDAVLA